MPHPTCLRLVYWDAVEKAACSWALKPVDTVMLQPEGGEHARGPEEKPGMEEA